MKYIIIMGVVDAMIMIILMGLIVVLYSSQNASFYCSRANQEPRIHLKVETSIYPAAPNLNSD